MRSRRSALPVVPLEVRTMLSGRDIETGNECPSTKRMERGSSARQKKPCVQHRMRRGKWSINRRLICL